MSIREFCRQRRLKDSQFYWWQRKLKGNRQERSKAGIQDQAASFALVSEDGMDVPAGLERVLRDGRRLRICSQESLSGHGKPPVESTASSVIFAWENSPAARLTACTPTRPRLF